MLEKTGYNGKEYSVREGELCMSGEEMLQGFFSGDASRILKACHAVNHAAISDRETIEAVAVYLDEIREVVKGKSYGGAVLPNQRFVDRAVTIIEESKRPTCLCKYVFDGFAQCAASLERSYGFILESEETKGFVNSGIIRCPRCGQRYLVEEEFTGWHMTSTRHRPI